MLRAARLAGYRPIPGRRFWARRADDPVTRRRNVRSDGKERSVQHVECRSAALTLPRVLVDRRHANNTTTAAAADAVAAAGANATSNFVPVANAPPVAAAAAAAT